MATYIREFETIEAFVTLLQTEHKTVAKVQKYKMNNSLPSISLSPSVEIKLGEHDSPKEISKKIEVQFGLSNCYDLNDWRNL